jgi:uncharacterized membrane protein YGL010W
LSRAAPVLQPPTDCCSPAISPLRSREANWASIAVLLTLLYYTALSLRLALGALPFLLACLWSFDRLDHWDGVPLWSICVVLFVVAWVGQFVGHAIEGKRPSFFKDVQYQKEQRCTHSAAVTQL